MDSNNTENSATFSPERYARTRIRFLHGSYLVTEDGERIGRCGDHGPHVENAKRIVACWNACLGMPIADIEYLAELDRGVMKLTVVADDYKAERDALRIRIKHPDYAADLLAEMLNMAHAGDAQENEDWAAIMQDAEVLVKRQAPINRGLERRIAITGARTTIETLAHMYQGGTDTEMPRWDTSVLAVTVAEPERVSQIKAIADAEKFLRDLGMVKNPIEGQPTIICFDDVAIYRWTEETT